MLFLMRSKCGKIREMWGFTVYLNRGWASKKQKGLMAEMAEMAETEATAETVESVESSVGIADREGRLMR